MLPFISVRLVGAFRSLADYNSYFGRKSFSYFHRERYCIAIVAGLACIAERMRALATIVKMGT
jgi:hypothetical protein